MPRRVGDWTLDKLKILEQYLPAYLSATQTAIERIYIDPFAGPQAFQGASVQTAYVGTTAKVID